MKENLWDWDVVVSGADMNDLDVSLTWVMRSSKARGGGGETHREISMITLRCDGMEKGVPDKWVWAPVQWCYPQVSAAGRHQKSCSGSLQAAEPEWRFFADTV